MPQYRDWPWGANDKKWAARCPELRELRRKWAEGKNRWKQMSNKQQRGSKDAGADGLWAKSRMWRERGEIVKQQCKDTWREEEGTWLERQIGGGSGASSLLDSSPAAPAPAMTIDFQQDSSAAAPPRSNTPLYLVAGAVGTLVVAGLVYAFLPE